jgi:hypothetical protein
MRHLEMRVERGLGGPVFVEEKFSGVFRRLVQVVVEAAGFFARGGDEADESFLQFFCFAGFGLEGGDDGDSFHGGFFGNKKRANIAAGAL